MRVARFPVSPQESKMKTGVGQSLTLSFALLVVLSVCKDGLSSDESPQKPGRQATTIADLTKAIEANPKDTDARLRRGRAYLDANRCELAIVDFTKAIDLKPRDYNGYCIRGVAYELLGEHEKAIADFTKSLEFHPKDAETYCNRGGSYSNSGQYEVVPII